MHPTRNIWLKILSLVLATALWFIIAREETAEAVMRAPIEFVNIPSQLEITGDPPSQVQIRIRASSTLMSKIYDKGPVARIDLRFARPGRRQIALNADNFDLPFGCQIIRITPTGFDVGLEERDSRYVTVSPRIEGRVADGYEMVSVTASPTRILVQGPMSRVRRLGTVTTEAVSVEGLVTSLSQRVALVIPDPTCRIPGENTVQLDITIVEKQDTRTFEGVIVETIPASRQATSLPKVVQVRVQGPISKVRWLRAEEVRARVDVSTLAPGQHDVPPRIVFSSDPGTEFRVIEILPANVRVTLR